MSKKMKDFTDSARVEYLGARRDLDRFAEAAAAWFAENPGGRTFTDCGIDPLLLAIRWGTHDRAVFVLRADEFFEPVIYGDIVPEATPDNPSASEFRERIEFETAAVRDDRGMGWRALTVAEAVEASRRWVEEPMLRASLRRLREQRNELQDEIEKYRRTVKVLRAREGGEPC